MKKPVLVLSGHNVELSIEANEFLSQDFFDFKKLHFDNMVNDPCYHFTQRISDKYSELANRKKLEEIARDPYDFDAIEKAHLAAERFMNSVVIRIQKSYLKKVAEVELKELGKPAHVGLPQFPTGGFSYAKIA